MIHNEMIKVLVCSLILMLCIVLLIEYKESLCIKIQILIPFLIVIAMVIILGNL